MIHVKQFLQEKIQPCIQQIFDHFLPQENFRSIHDLFNVHKFHKLLMLVLLPQVKNKLHDVELPEENQANNLTYNEMKIKGFQKVLDIIEQTYQINGVGITNKIDRKDIGVMVNELDFHLLNQFLECVFDLLQPNKEIISFLVTLDEQLQGNIFQYMNPHQMNQNAKQKDEKQSEGSINSLRVLSKLPQQSNTDQLQQLQTTLLCKEQEINKITQEKESFVQQTNDLREIIYKKDEDIQLLKRRLQSYEEEEQLYKENNYEMIKQTQKIAELQLKVRIKQNEFHSQKMNLQQKVADLETRYSQISHKYERHKHQMDIITKQKEQSEISKKKVIDSLKEKNKLLTEKLNELQRDLIQANFQNQLKDKQIHQLRALQSSKRQEPFLDKEILQTLTGLSSPRSPFKDDKQDFLDGPYSVRVGQINNLSEQMSQTMFQQNKALGEDDEGIYKSVQGSNKRFGQMLQQNHMLRQQVQQLINQSKQIKEFQDEIGKLNKKINIFKRRNEQAENHHRQELDLMIGVMEQCYINSSQTAHHLAAKK